MLQQFARLLGAAALVFGVPLPICAQSCVDPVPPAGGGFRIAGAFNQPFTWSDGATTAIDYRFPNAAPGPCGWPVVIVVHGFGGPNAYTTPAIDLVRAGFMTVLYRVRGQSTAGGNTDFFGRDSRLDLAEIIAEVGQRYGAGPNPLADPNRIGVTGVSQGGIHSWIAAAWSGKALPSNSRGLATFPTVRAAFAEVGEAWQSDTFLPEGKAAHTYMCTYWLGNAGSFRRDPAIVNQMRAWIRAENYAAAKAFLDRDPIRDDLGQLATSNVPVFAWSAYDDYFFTLDGMARGLAALPTTTPARLFLDASGISPHGSDENRNQMLRLARYRERWFRRYLSGDANEVDLEPRFISGVVPAGVPVRQASLRNRVLTTWPPRPTRRYFLRAAGTLSVGAPSGAAPASMISHRVPPGYDLSQWYAATGTQASRTLAVIPLSSVSFDGPPVRDHAEVAGNARVRLELSSADTRFQVHCTLLRVDARGDENYLSSGFHLQDEAQAPGDLAVEVVLHQVHAALLPGEHLRLRVENLVLRRTRDPAGNGSQYLQLVPYFQPADIAVHHSASRVSWVDLALDEPIAPALTVDTAFVLTTFPRDVTYEIQASTAATNYALLFGASGIVPSLPLGGSPLWLELDPVTVLLASSANSTLLINTVGALDPMGQASSTLALRAAGSITALQGVEMSAAAVVLERGRLRPSNPVQFSVR